MENTPALHNNWEYATAPDPTALGLAGVDRAVAPFMEQMRLRREYQHEAQVAAQQNAYAQQLQQLRLDSVAKNVSARDAALLNWHAAHDAAMTQQRQIQEKAQSDAAAERGAQVRLTSLAKEASALGVPIPPSQPGQTTDQHADAIDAALQAPRKKQFDGLVGRVQSGLQSATEYASQLTALKNKAISQAQANVTASIPTWIQGQTPELQAAYTAAAKANPNASPQDIVRSNPALVSAFAPYANAATQDEASKVLGSPGYKEQFTALSLDVQKTHQDIDAVLKTHPQAGDIWATASKNLLDIQTQKADEAAKSSILAQQSQADQATKAQLAQQAAVEEARRQKMQVSHDAAMNSLQQVGLVGKIGADNLASAGKLAALGVVNPLAVAPTLAVEGLSKIAPNYSPDVLKTWGNSILFGTPSGTPTPQDVAAFAASRGRQVDANGNVVPRPNPLILPNGVAPVSTNGTPVIPSLPAMSTPEALSALGWTAPQNAPAQVAPAPAPSQVLRLPDSGGAESEFQNLMQNNNSPMNSLYVQ